MIELTGKQKKRLRALGRNLHTGAIIGKAGLSDGAVESIKALLDRHELIKIRLLPPMSDRRKEAALDIAATLDALCAAVVGSTVLLYRPNEELDADQRILLT